MPQISYADTITIVLPKSGQWIIKSLDPAMRINLQSSIFSGMLE